MGRAGDTAAALDHLRSHRLVTLTGTGGIGKTRLANELATRLDTIYPGGSVMVALTGAKPDDDLEHYAARQLGQSSLDAFLMGVTGRATIIVLDNCEHVVDQARLLLERLLDHPDLRMVATSRVALGISGERVMPIAPLPLTTAEQGPSDALHLFLDRAEAAGAEWPRTEENLEAAAAIVRAVDGVPLAIELAAARSRLLAPGELVEMLTRQLDLLDSAAAREGRDHRSIRSTIFASYDPLPSEAKRLLRRMSVLSDLAGLDLIHDLNEVDDRFETLDQLATLVDHSLVVTHHDDAGHTTYRMLEPIRAYASEQLDVTGEAAGAEEALVAAMTRFADATVARALEQFSPDVIDSIARNHSHLVAAVERSITTDPTPDRAVRLYLPFYAPTRAPRWETAELGRRVRETWPSLDAPLRAEALAVMAHSSMWAGMPDTDQLAHAAIADPSATALARTIAYRVLAFRAGHADDRTAALGHIEAALAEAEALGGSFQRELRMSWASLVDDPARREEAIELLSSTSVEAAANNEIVTLVWATVTLAHHQLLDRDLGAAQRSAERSQELASQTAAPWARCAALRINAAVLTIRRQWPDAFAAWGTAFESVVSVGDIEGVALTLRSAAAAADYVGERELADGLWALAQPGRGASALPHLFRDQQTDLDARGEDVTPRNIDETVRLARRAFATGPARTSPPSEPELAAASDIVRFGHYELDSGMRELRCDGEPIHVEPQVFDVLAVLAGNAGRLVTKEELLDAVWGDRFVSPSALTSRIKTARAATGDDGTAQRVIRTVHGRGFMFVADVH